jgi:hypothetical protein
MQAGVPRDCVLNVKHADEFEAWLGDR